MTISLSTTSPETEVYRPLGTEENLVVGPTDAAHVGADGDLVHGRFLRGRLRGLRLGCLLLLLLVPLGPEHVGVDGGLGLEVVADQVGGPLRLLGNLGRLAQGQRGDLVLAPAHGGAVALPGELPRGGLLDVLQPLVEEGAPHTVAHRVGGGRRIERALNLGGAGEGGWRRCRRRR